MVVAASPGSEVSVAPELGLIKAALLYGDEVTLLSPVTTMFLGVEGLGRFSMIEQVRLIRMVAPYLMENGVEELLKGFDTLDTVLRARGAGSRLLQARLTEMMRPAQETLSAEIATIVRNAEVDQLARARAEGLLKIESANPATTIDLISDVVIAAKLRERGEPTDSGHAERMVATFVGKLSDHLSLGREYLLLDESVADLTKAAIKAGMFKPADGPAGRSAQAMTASGLMGRLPTFPDATVDEVLDIREVLAPALTQFRSAMVTLSKDFKSPAWETGFEDEVHDAWIESVHPAVEAIDSSVCENKSLLAMTTGTLKAGSPGLAILGAGAVGHDDPVLIAGAAASITGPLFQALRDYKATATSIKMQPFYFLYALRKALPED
jgi:hypothetical protein